MHNLALFLDRDGVVNIDYGYVHKREDFHFIDGIFDLARCAHREKYKIVIVTNQAGIARGYYNEEQFHQLNEWMCQKFLEEDAPITQVYFSPYHPTAGLGPYLKDHISRKPNPGMILQAKADLSIDLGSSLLIGDNISDIKAGNAAGVGESLLLVQRDLGALEVAELSRLDYKQIKFLNEALPYLTRSIQ